MLISASDVQYNVNKADLLNFKYVTCVHRHILYAAKWHGCTSTSFVQREIPIIFDISDGYVHNVRSHSIGPQTQNTAPELSGYPGLAPLMPRW